MSKPTADEAREVLVSLGASSSTVDTSETHVALFMGRPPDEFVGYRLNPTASLAGSLRDLVSDFASPLAENARCVPYEAGRISLLERSLPPSESVPGLVSLRDELSAPLNLPLFLPGDIGKARFECIACP